MMIYIFHLGTTLRLPVAQEEGSTYGQAIIIYIYVCVYLFIYLFIY